MASRPGKHTRKFLFDTDFLDDRPRMASPEPVDVEPAEPEPPPPPTFTEEELESARSAGFTEGRAQGLIEAQSSIERQTAMALERLAGGLKDLFEQHHRHSEAVVHDAAQLAHTIARKICPELAQRNALVEIEALTRQAVEYLADEPRVIVRMNAASLEALGDRLQAIMRTAGFEGQVLLRNENALGDGDCRIEWANGGAERLTEQLWAQIDEMCAHFLKGQPPAEADTPIPARDLDDIQAPISAPAIATTAAAPAHGT
jgi:flagellar assembly protein FliH